MNPKQTVEQFHLIFLNFLGQKLDKKLYALKGGCNMRFYFKSIRYSEDMDLDVRTIAKETLKNKVSQIIESTPFNNILRSKKIELVNWSEHKQTETTQRWKITLKSSQSMLPIPTKIEFSRRKLDAGIQFETVDTELLRQYSLSPIMSNHYDAQTMYEQKILALALRSQVQARDVFDLYLLITTHNNLTRCTEPVRTQIEKALENASQITFTNFKGQVLAYLSEDYAAQYNDEKIWDNIVLTVTDALTINL